MIKKVLMISENDIASNVSLGVTKKILGQYKAFQNLGYDVYNLCLENGEGVLIHGEEKKIVVPQKIKSYFTVAQLYTGAANVCSEYGIDCCYIRFPLADWAFMKMIKKLHKICKVVVEIPTYPYDEIVRIINGIIPKINHFQDKINRNKLSRYIDYFVAYSDDNAIFGKKCISIGNGINIEDVTYLGNEFVYKDDIVLIAVALVVYGHGIDRLLAGMNNYYKSFANSRKIYLNIVGNGPEIPHLKDLAEKNNISQYVSFHGALYGETLDKVFLKSNLGVSGLAGHREKLKTVSPLKSREYCAKGLPFFGTTKDHAFPEDKCPFYKLFPANDDPIDIEQVIEFYEYIKAHPEIHRQMRTYAEENLTWEKQLKKVMDEVDKP